MGPTGEDSWQSYRRKMLAETEHFIEWGLRHPELVNWIPAKLEGTGRFPRKVTNWFYQTVFSGQDSRHGHIWRDRLRQAFLRKSDPNQGIQDT